MSTVDRERRNPNWLSGNITFASLIAATAVFFLIAAKNRFEEFSSASCCSSSASLSHQALCIARRVFAV